MMRCNTFGRSLLFAAIAATGLLVLAALLVPPLHLSSVLAFYVVAVVALYVVGIAPRIASGLAAGALASLLGGVLLLLPLSIGEVAVGGALIVAVCRSAILYRARPLRALLLELALFAGGLTLAHLLASGGIASVAFGLWGYFLAQSVFFLVGGVTERRDREGAVDPFERARARLLALLDAP